MADHDPKTAAKWMKYADMWIKGAWEISARYHEDRLNDLCNCPKHRIMCLHCGFNFCKHDLWGFARWETAGDVEEMARTSTVKVCALCDSHIAPDVGNPRNAEFLQRYCPYDDIVHNSVVRNAIARGQPKSAASSAAARVIRWRKRPGNCYKRANIPKLLSHKT
jgi:hypothetical protein